jgi:hypothetical protein
MIAQRPRLSREAAADYPNLRLIAGTDLLLRPDWLPDAPLPLDRIRLQWRPDTPFTGLTGSEPVTADVRPEPYPTYAEAIAALAAPTVFENRPLYRLLAGDLRAAEPTLAFGRGHYFDVVNIGESVGHEYCARGVGPLRQAIGDPTDPTRRTAALAVSTLTVRTGQSGSTFLLHWRDPARVAHAGGLYQVVPVGVFQAADEAPWNESNDFDLWRNMVREFNEELLGGEEKYGAHLAPIDYDAHPLYARLSAGRAESTVRPYVLGMGVDPLTLAVDLLTVVILDGDIFDDVFGRPVAENAEGQVLAGLPLTEANIERYTVAEPMQPAGAATLRLAWRHRHELGLEVS